MGRMPLRPCWSESQNSETFLPMAEMTPTPVTATRIMRWEGPVLSRPLYGPAVFRFQPPSGEPM